MKRIQLTSFNIPVEKNNSQNNSFTERLTPDSNGKSIVLLLQSDRLNYIQQNFRTILQAISIFASIFNLTHTVLMIASILPVWDASPAIPGDIFIIVITVAVDFTMLGCVYLSFIHKINFSKFEKKARALGFNHDHPMMANILKKARRKVTIIGLLFVSSWLLNVIVFSVIFYMNHYSMGSTVTTIELFHVYNFILIPLLPSNKIFTLFTSAIFIRSVFTLFNRKLINHSTSQWTFADLRFYRKMYSRAIDLTKSTSQIWQNFLVIFYPVINGFVLLFIFYTISGPVSIIRYSCLGLLAATICLLFVYTNQFITGVNIEAFSVYDTVYIISLNNKDVTYTEEANLFLKRIGRQDVGFSYETYMVYSPRLVGSVLTLLSTIMIAFPTFTRH
uniref:Gustatory receptor n=1 Tax=Tetranychus urticae TaxID=32264 RepID=T1KRY9_TETUR